MRMYIHHVYTEVVVSDPKRTRTFKSGNSVAVRLPKSLGIEAGQELNIVREEGGRFRFEPAKPKSDKIDLTGIAGSIPWLKPLTPEEREFEERELDWEGKLLPRG